MVKKSGLNKVNVMALLGGQTATGTTPAAAITNTASTTDSVAHLPITALVPGASQPRTHMPAEALAELTASIQKHGILQPILVRKQGQVYEIIAGERRWRAAQAAGLSTVPVLVKTLSDDLSSAIALVENMQRQDLSPLDEAMGIERLLQQHQLTHQEVAELLGKSRAAVSNSVRLLTLSAPVKELLAAQKLEVGHAKVLLSLPLAQQQLIANKIVAGGLSVRAAEALVAELSRTTTLGMGKHPIDPNILHLEQKLSKALGSKVQLKHHNSGRGQIVIAYHNLDVLDGILEHILATTPNHYDQDLGKHS
jgi:ParB family chromosome partitioning protein